MASLSVDEKDWLKNKFEQCVNLRLMSQRRKHGVTSGMLRNNVILQNLIVTVQKLNYHAAQIERMQNQIKFMISYINNHD